MCCWAKRGVIAVGFGMWVELVLGVGLFWLLLFAGEVEGYARVPVRVCRSVGHDG